MSASVQGQLTTFLVEHGFEVVSAKGLGYERIPDGAATQPILHELGVAAYSSASRARSRPRTLDQRHFRAPRFSGRRRFKLLPFG